MGRLGRRKLLAGTAVSLIFGTGCWLDGTPARAAIVQGSLPWQPYAGDPPAGIGPGQWHFFSAEEGAMVEALVDRLIPPDADTPGGKDAGCAVFIDRQLAGPYGRSSRSYMRPPFRDGTESQGPQSPLTPADRYRMSLAALDAHCQAAFGRGLPALSPDAQDKLIHGLENNSLPMQGPSARAFFELLLKDTRYGFFADPIYGGNRGMAAWRMIGFPGARYDYRDWIDRHNERYPLPPLGIAGRPAWSDRE